MLGEGAHARVQTCINLITNQEYAVKVSTAPSPVPLPLPSNAWDLAFKLLESPSVQKLPLESRSAWAEPQVEAEWEVTMKFGP